MKKQSKWEKFKDWVITWLIPIMKKSMIAYLRRKGYKIEEPKDKKDK